MTWGQQMVLIVVAWLSIATVVALLIGRAIHNRDERDGYND